MDGLVLGIDIGDEASHVSFYDSSRSLAETVPFEGNSQAQRNHMPLSSIYAIDGQQGQVREMMKLLAPLIAAARKHCGCNRVDRLCITTDVFSRQRLDVIRRACVGLDGDMDRIAFISHEECLGFYAFNLHQDMWRNGVVLMDYSSQGLHACRLEQLKVRHQEVIAQTATDADACEKVIDGLKIADRIQGLKAVEDRLLLSAKNVIQDKPTSSVYLTGPGFDTTTLPGEFLQYVCNRHRVFAGQNIYVNGACEAAWRSGQETKVSLACHNRLAVTIDMDIVERGKNMLFRVAQAGTNWYHACRQVDFIADMCDHLTLHMHPMGDAGDYDEVIDFGEFPYREGKTTRLGVSFMFKGDDCLEVEIVDKGFGDFVKPSGKTVTRTLKL